MAFGFQFTCDPHEFVFFAFSYPFSYEEILAKIDRLETSLADEYNIYFHKEILYNSCEGRPMHLLTISSKDG